MKFYPKRFFGDLSRLASDRCKSEQQNSGPVPSRETGTDCNAEMSFSFAFLMRIVRFFFHG